MLGGLAEISCEVQALPVQTSVPRQPVIKTLLHDLTTLVRISAMKTQDFVGVLIKRDAGQVFHKVLNLRNRLSNAWTILSQRDAAKPWLASRLCLRNRVSHCSARTQASTAPQSQRWREAPELFRSFQLAFEVLKLVVFRCLGKLLPWQAVQSLQLTCDNRMV